MLYETADVLKEQANSNTERITIATPYRRVPGAPTPTVLAGIKNPAVNWNLIDQLRQGINVPVILKGVMTPDEADAAVKKGCRGSWFRTSADG